MAMLELQFRTQAFFDFFKAEINRRRLPAPTLNTGILPDIDGKLLQRIECTSCELADPASEGQVTVDATLVFHHNSNLVDVRAAGSLQTPAMQQAQRTLPITFSVAFVAPSPGATPEPRLQWALPFGIVAGGGAPLNLPRDIRATVGAVVANEEVVVIRLGTRADDPVLGPIVSRLEGADWTLFISGQIFADIVGANLATSLAAAETDKIKVTKAAGAAWFPGFNPGDSPFVGASATVTAIDACLFDIDVPIDMQLTLHLQPSGHSLVSTMRTSWDADSTLCDIVSGLFLTPIASIVVNVLAEDGASEALLGRSSAPEGFAEIARDDDSITYQRTAFLDTPSPAFILNRSAVVADGLVTGGTLAIPFSQRKLEGEATAPRSELVTNCSNRSVSVQFAPASVALRDLAAGGPPALFPDRAWFDPPNAWVVAPGASNTWLDLALAFKDPPGGRLPAGTATSVYLHTDCGLRWVDLGIIPPDHPAPTQADVAQMISRCMALSDPWGLGVMNLDWLVDPPDVFFGIDPVREWHIGFRGLPREARLRVVAVRRDGEEREVATLSGQRNVALQLFTSAEETLQVRTEEGFSAPAPIVSQRWLSPFARVALNGSPATLASIDGEIGIRDAEGRVHLIRPGDQGGEAASITASEDGAAVPERLREALAHEESRGRTPTTARVDQHTVAFVHNGEVMLAATGQKTRL